jgi:hypothetical protein
LTAASHTVWNGPDTVDLGCVPRQPWLTLEAVSNLLLAAALALSVGVRRPQVWQLWSAGALLGMPTATKIWGVVPLLVIVAFLWHRDGRAVGGKVNRSPQSTRPAERRDRPARRTRRPLRRQRSRRGRPEQGPRHGQRSHPAIARIIKT